MSFTTRFIGLVKFTDTVKDFMWFYTERTLFNSIIFEVFFFSKLSLFHFCNLFCVYWLIYWRILVKKINKQKTGTEENNYKLKEKKQRIFTRFLFNLRRWKQKNFLLNIALLNHIYSLAYLPLQKHRIRSTTSGRTKPAADSKRVVSNTVAVLSLKTKFEIKFKTKCTKLIAIYNRYRWSNYH